MSPAKSSRTALFGALLAACVLPVLAWLQAPARNTAPTATRIAPARARRPIHLPDPGDRQVPRLRARIDFNRASTAILRRKSRADFSADRRPSASLPPEDERRRRKAERQRNEVPEVGEARHNRDRGGEKAEQQSHVEQPQPSPQMEDEQSRNREEAVADADIDGVGDAVSDQIEARPPSRAPRR